MLSGHIGLYLNNGTKDLDIIVNDYVLTNVALSESDVMMLDISANQ